MSDVPATALDQVRRRKGGRSARAREAILTATLQQLARGGYGSLSYSDVAKEAGVDRATVYRRWPTRARLTMDALMQLADAAVPVPDTGEVESDMRALAGQIATLLADAQVVRMFGALAAALSEDDALREVGGELWRLRFAGAGRLIVRARERGELGGDEDPAVALELLISPLYFRALLRGQAPDKTLVERCVASAMRQLRAG